MDLVVLVLVTFMAVSFRIALGCGFSFVTLPSFLLSFFPALYTI
jgi:hypothetical protein